MIPRRTFIAGAAAAVGLPAAAQRDTGFIPSELRAMQDLARAFMGRYGVPALSVAIAKDGRLVYTEAFGTADDKAERATPTHRFRIASVSKPITSVTIMGLAERGKLRLSDTVFGKNGVLGEAYGTPPYKRYVEQITVEHLLTHTCGGWSNSGPDPDPMFTHPRMGHAQLIGWTIDNLPVRHAPGTNFAYSNFGYCVLGRVIEKVGGSKYDEYVKENVLRRCGIRDMEIAGNTLDERKPREVVYIGQNGENPYNMQVARMDAHGGWIASPTDLVRFLVRVDGYDTKPDILSPAIERVMTTGSSANAGYAMGWSVNTAGNYWHNGSLPGTITLMVRTRSGFCWAALTNTRRPGSSQDGDLDRLMWNMVQKVTAWPSGDMA
ncbi:MAG TPA: serine hydrolase domain-containing protein [Chthonomonadaceae bacterium]|nr:serine hydrolase domain-containing protein [Chthonomonadaceae bacterium]